MVSTDHPLASRAGALVLEQGGNAVDAAVAAALAAGVVQPAGSGLGGGGFALVVDGGDAAVLDFREVAPAEATRDMYRTPEGGVHPTASRQGGLAVAVPAQSRGLARLLEEHGTLSPREVVRPALRYARSGYAVGFHLAGALVVAGPQVHQLLALDGRDPTEGERVRNPALARTLQRWAATGGEDLHTGTGAARLVDTVRAQGGLVSARDLEACVVAPRQAVRGTYRGYTVLTMPPPSSGGVLLLQMLGVLEQWDIASLGHNSSDHVHLVVEAMKHAFADRAWHFGDPDHVDVPVERLLSAERTHEIGRAIWPGRTFAPGYYGELVIPPDDAGTQHISVIDSEGGAVALTTTINTLFGSQIVVPELGVILNNEMDDFSIAPGVPNAYGLVGAEANAVAPGKRPLSSMTPTVVLDPEGEVLLAVGASGGSAIISSVLQVIMNSVDFGLDAEEAVSAPRFHHQWQPDRLELEVGFPLDVHRALIQRGHQVVETEPRSAVQLVAVVGSWREGAADPRKGGQPAAVR